jgi:hypothetical protein
MESTPESFFGRVRCFPAVRAERGSLWGAAALASLLKALARELRASLADYSPTEFR